MEFKRIDINDFNQLKSLHFAYKNEINEIAPTEENMIELRKAIEEDQILYYGCLIDDILVASCSVSPIYSTFIYGIAGIFEDFYVLPKFRHMGIAHQLVNYAFTKSGVGFVIVGFADCDIKMYESLGFTIQLGNMLVKNN